MFVTHYLACNQESIQTPYNFTKVYRILYGESEFHTFVFVICKIYLNILFMNKQKVHKFLNYPRNVVSTGIFGYRVG